MCGIPGSGKSTWVANRVGEGSVWASRDAVRFSMLQEGDDYFAYEDDVLLEWHNQIYTALKEGKDVYVDATHLTPKARKKILNKFNLKNVDVHAIWFNVPLETCLERNEKREGRAVVPRSVIYNMYHNFTPPTAEEYPYKSIVEVTT